MKSLIKLPLVAVAFAMAIPFTQAQDTATPPPPPPAGEQGPGGKEGPGRGAPRGDRFKMFAEKLALTEEQQAKIKPIFVEEGKAMKAIWDDQSLDKSARREKMAEIFKKTMEQIKPMLTPEQLKKLDEMKDEFMRGRGPGGPRKEKAKE